MDEKLTKSQRIWRQRARVLITGSLIAASLGILMVLDTSGVFDLGHANDQVMQKGEIAERDRKDFHGKTFRVAYVVDGDTLDIYVSGNNGKRQRIRLWGVDTPETVKPNCDVEHFGPEASELTKTLCRGKNVRVEIEPDEHSRDKYDRLLAYIFLPDGQMLNSLLIKRGYGYCDRRYKHMYYEEFKILQKNAKTDKAGLWKDVKMSDLPYYYR